MSSMLNPPQAVGRAALDVLAPLRVSQQPAVKQGWHLALKADDIAIAGREDWPRPCHSGFFGGACSHGCIVGDATPGSELDL